MNDTLNTINDIDTLEIAHSFECDVTDLNKYLNVKKTDFTVISQNIRSIYSNFDDFLINISSLSINTDVII